jgi:hypothetical protein
MLYAPIIELYAKGVLKLKKPLAILLPIGNNACRK